VGREMLVRMGLERVVCVKTRKIFWFFFLLPIYTTLEILLDFSFNNNNNNNNNK
jgi:hypothetical protein